MMASINKRRNYNGIDLCKIIMAVFVIAIHTNPLEDCSNITVLIIYDLLVRMAVPFFFLSSGYLLASKFDPDNVQINIDIIVKYLIRITKMYIVWSILYFPLAIQGYYIEGVSLWYAVFSYARGLLLIGEHYNSWQLWYLLSTIYGLVLSMLLLRSKCSTKVWLLIICVLCSLSVLMDELVNMTVLPPALRIVKRLISITIANGRILQGSFLIPLGILLNKSNLSLKYCTVLFVISFASNYFIDNAAVSSILLFISSVSVFVGVVCLEFKNCFIYPIMRKLSTDIYLIHMYIWTFYYMAAYNEKRYGWDSFVVTTVVSLAVGLLHLGCSGNNAVSDRQKKGCV